MYRNVAMYVLYLLYLFKSKSIHLKTYICRCNPGETFSTDMIKVHIHVLPILFRNIAISLCMFNKLAYLCGSQVRPPAVLYLVFINKLYTLCLLVHLEKSPQKNYSDRDNCILYIDGDVTTLLSLLY